MSDTLDLVLKHKYYDMIASGEKWEEYRDTLFWCVRLLNVDRDGYGHFTKACCGDFEDMKRNSNDSCDKFTQLLKKSIEDGIFEYRHYDTVRFHRGYTSTSMTFEVKGISIGNGREEWGAEKGKETFIIKLGKRIV